MNATMNFAGFEKIAPHLASPLVLVGFVLMLAYAIHWQLMKSGLLSKVDKKDSSLIIRLFLRYGFWLALTLLLAGFSLAAWSKHLDTAKIISIDVRKTAELLSAQLGIKDQQLSAKDEQIKALTEAITALPKTGAPAKSINSALQELEQGHTTQAQAIFVEVLRSKEAEGRKANKEAAAAARHLGALAYMNNPKEALLAYRKAVELDPDNATGWNGIELLLQRTGGLANVEKIHKKVLAVNNTSGCKEGSACANINVYRTRGDLDNTREIHRNDEDRINFVIELIKNACILGEKFDIEITWDGRTLFFLKKNKVEFDKDEINGLVNIVNRLSLQEKYENIRKCMQQYVLVVLEKILEVKANTALEFYFENKKIPVDYPVSILDKRVILTVKKLYLKHSDIKSLDLVVEVPHRNKYEITLEKDNNTSESGVFIYKDVVYSITVSGIDTIDQFAVLSVSRLKM